MEIRLKNIVPKKIAFAYISSACLEVEARVVQWLAGSGGHVF